MSGCARGEREQRYAIRSWPGTETFPLPVRGRLGTARRLGVLT